MYLLGLDCFILLKKLVLICNGPLHSLVFENVETMKGGEGMEMDSFDIRDPVYMSSTLRPCRNILHPAIGVLP